MTEAPEVAAGAIIAPIPERPIDVRPVETWMRYARTAALALRADAGFGLDREGEAWTILGRYPRSADAASETMFQDLHVLEADDSFALQEAVHGLAVTFRSEGARLGLLAVRSAQPRQWSRREWEVLKALAESMAREIALEAKLSAPGADPGPERGPEVGNARLRLHPDLPDGLLAELRRSILAAVHEGSGQAGDRLPSIREIAEACATTTYAVARAYKTLEGEGIVEMRERSGVYIASLGETPLRRLPETANWLREVVAGGYLLQVKLPALPDLIHRWTRSRPLRCACVEGSEDYLVALSEEIRGQFGLEALELPVLDAAGSGGRVENLESGVRRADLIVTTPFHLARVRGLAARLDIPLVVATLDDASAQVIATRVRTVGHLDLVCVDPAFGERMLVNLDLAERRRIRVTSVTSAAELAGIDRGDPILITKAARQHLARDDFRLLLPQFPTFSRRFAERLAHTIIQLNLEGLRRGGAGA